MEQLHDTHLISNSSMSNHSFGNDWEEKAYKFDEATFNTLVRGMQTQADKIENTKNKRRRFKLESIAENNKSISLLKKFPLKEGNNIDQTKKIIQFKHYNISELTEVEILNGKMSIIEIKKERHNVFFREPNLNIEFQGNKNIIQDKFSREVEITYQGKTSLKITRLIGGINNGEFYIDQNPNILSIEDITRRGIINTALIRTMAKAKYQETNIGHFGLGSKCYTHFTSPIRRYPDLLVHRLIKEFLFNETFVDVSDRVSFYNSKVNQAGIISSKTERIAEKLERDAEDYKKCEYMEKFIGDKFVGTISSIMNFGAFIKLDNTVEGMCRFADMHDDYYVYDENRMCFVGNKFKITYSLGDRVVIRVMDTCKETREINFRILGKEINRGC